MYETTWIQYNENIATIREIYFNKYAENFRSFDKNVDIEFSAYDCASGITFIGDVQRQKIGKSNT